jgi:glycolate oxidase
MMPKEIYREVSKIVGEKNVTANLFELVNNSLDPLPYEYIMEDTPLPYLVAKPATEKEISGLFKYANKKDIPVYVRGSGTSFTGSARAPHKGIILSTSRMNSIKIDFEYGFFECGPGASVLNVDMALAKKGYFLPVYPGSKMVATMGGMIAGNTSGHIIDACVGKPSDYVLGVRVVTPTGDIIETGTKAQRRPAGTDLTKFFVGNDGLTGIVTNIRMRLVPEKKKAYGIAYFNSAEAAAKAIVRMYRDKAPPPLFMEFMDHATTTIGFEHAGLPAPPGCSIFFASWGDTKERANENTDILLDIMDLEKPLNSSKITDLEEWEKIWTAREVIIASLMQRHDGVFSGPEIVTTLPKLIECTKELENYTNKADVLNNLPFYLLGHIGALTFHPTVIVPRNWENDRKKEVVNTGFHIEKEMNSRFETCGGEWLQFGKRTAFFKQRYGNGAYEIIRKIKRVFDPNDILARGILNGM